jgi:membrane fusion protein, multidrug efflux system
MIKVNRLSEPRQWFSLIFIALVLAGCGSAKQEQSEQIKNDQATKINIIPIEIAAAEHKNIAVTKTYSGTLEGEEQANIVAKISERITSIQAHVGEATAKGHVIVTLDKSGTSSQYFQTEANFRNAEKNLQRMKSLYDEGAISLQALDGVQTAYEIAKANFDAARSSVDLATPIAGVVTAVNVSIGDLATPGAVLATIANIKRMKVIFNISETDVVNLAIGQKVEVFIETKPDEKVEGQIIQLSKSADVRSRSFEIKAIFPNTTDLWFKPGLFCKVTVQISPEKTTLVVPNSAIQSDGTSNYVYTVHKGRSFQRPVQLGISNGEYTEIIQGLGEQDSVVTLGVTNVKDSSYVNIVR